jgi:hypothetical protein
MELSCGIKSLHEIAPGDAEAILLNVPDLSWGSTKRK